MASINSMLITNRNATPPVANEPWTNAKVKTTGSGIIEVSTSEVTNNIFRFCRVRSNAVIREVLLSCDAIPTTGAMDVGLRETATNGGGVVDNNFFATAQDLTSALVTSNVAHGGGAYDIADRNKRIWEVLGLSEDPNKWYDVVGVVTTNMGGAGTLAVEVTYVDSGA